VGGFFDQKGEMKLTLFYTAPRAPGVWEKDRDYEALAQSEQLGKEYEIKGRKALEKAAKELSRLGFRPEKLTTRFQVRKISKLADIIQEGEQGLYDAVVLGRRGLSWLETAFDESVTKGFLEQKVSFPIWICRKPAPNRKNVLVCVDGSEASMRMLDHVGFVLNGEVNHAVTLLMVSKTGGSAESNADEVLANAEASLLLKSFSQERIKTKVVADSSVARAILKEVEKGGHAAVAVGRTGVGRGFMQKLFMGSVSETLFKELHGAALWICY
jgi:nucleotide-binding universal stress UspA family protein